MAALRRNAWVLTAAAISLVVTVQPFRDTDVWWHLALGRQILAHGIPSQEPFSFLHAANPWVGQQWLYEVILARLVDVGGFGAVSLGMGALASAALLVAALSIPPERRPSGPWMAAALLIGALIAAQLVGVRGQVVSLFGAAVMLYVVMRWRCGSDRWLLLLPPLFCLWANLHAGFIVGVGIGVLALLVVPNVTSRARVLLAATLGVSLLGTLINPAGLGLWRYVTATFGNPTLTSLAAEWQAPDFHNPWLRLFEAGGITLALCWFAAPRRDPWDVVLGVVAIAAALQAQRNVSLFAIVATPQLARYGAEAWSARRHDLPRLPHPRGLRAPAPQWFSMVLAVVIVAGTVMAVAPRLTASAAARYEAAHLPSAAASYVGRHLASRRIYSPDTWGGYLAERFPEGRVVYLYDETAVFGEAALQQYLDAHALRAAWPTVFASNGITVAILPTRAQEVSALLTVGWTIACRDAVSESVVMAPPASGTSGVGEAASATGC